MDLPTYNIDQRLLAGLLQDTFMDNYKDAKFFQANLKCSGEERCELHGTVCFYKTVRRRNARTRFRDKLVSCFEKLSSSSADNKSFRNHLEKSFILEEDATSLSGDTHFWRIAGAPSSAAGASAARGGALPALPVGPSIGGGQAAAASIAWPPPPPVPGFYADAQGVYGHRAAAYPGGRPVAAYTAGVPFSPVAAGQSICGGPAAASAGPPPAAVSAAAAAGASGRPPAANPGPLPFSAAAAAGHSAAAAAPGAGHGAAAAADVLRAGQSICGGPAAAAAWPPQPLVPDDAAAVPGRATVLPPRLGTPGPLLFSAADTRRVRCHRLIGPPAHWPVDRRRRLCGGCGGAQLCCGDNSRC